MGGIAFFDKSQSGKSLESLWQPNDRSALISSKAKFFDTASRARGCNSHAVEDIMCRGIFGQNDLTIVGNFAAMELRTDECSSLNKNKNKKDKNTTARLAESLKSEV